MRLLLCLLLSVAGLFGFSSSLLQEQFQSQVIEKNIFKEHFKTFLNQECIITDEQCINNNIQRLKTWESTRRNRFLQQDIKKRYQRTLLTPTQTHAIKKHIQKVAQKQSLTHSQFITLVDLSQQRLSVVFYDAPTHDVHIIGTDLISTGNIEKEKEILFGEDHYLKTPTGLFENKKGWRSNGKYNLDTNVLAYGRKERFVFYFGKQRSIRYNTFDKQRNKLTQADNWQLITDYLEFAMHSHESSKNMGEPNSHGCIRITHELNLFLDEELILHQNNIRNGKWTNNARPPKNFSDKMYSGKYLLILDKI